MNQNKMTGYILIFAGVTFWISWFLMPDPGTTDAAHILAIVKEKRTSVFASVIVQIVSSAAYIVALCLMAQRYLPQRKVTFAGIVLLGIGVLGLCSDAFFHLLAFYMTDSTVNMQADVIAVMTFMQTGGVAFLVPLLLPFFIGSLLLALGLHRQRVTTKLPQLMIIAAFTLGPLSVVIGKTIFEYQGNVISLCILGLVALGQANIGVQMTQTRS